MYPTRRNENEIPGYHFVSGELARLIVPDSIDELTVTDPDPQDDSDDDDSSCVTTKIVPVDAFANGISFEVTPQSITVFPMDAIGSAEKRTKRLDSETRDRLKATVSAMKRNNGQRQIPCLERESLDGICSSLRTRFPNFTAAANLIESELLLAMASTPDAFRISPILLYGSPGTGKTSFATAFARSLNVGFDRITAAGAQGGFDIVGTSSHWSNSAPGRVATLLIDGEFATPVLLIDEVDKISDDARYPVMPALLELLEPGSAIDFRDESLGICFDASKIIVIATANDIGNVPAPLLSRLCPIEVQAPGIDERKIIARTIFQELVQNLMMEVAIEDEAINKLANTPVDIRMMGRSLRQAIGAVLMQCQTVVTAKEILLPKIQTSPGIGFI